MDDTAEFGTISSFPLTVLSSDPNITLYRTIAITGAAEDQTRPSMGFPGSHRMNAEEKKHPTNALAAGLERLWTQIKGRRLYVYGGITVFVVAVVVLVYVLRRNVREADALRWRELDSANTEEKLKELIQSDKQKGKITQTLAKLDLSRIYTYDRGINQLGTTMTSEFDKAITELEAGREYYLDAVNGLKDNPMLVQEAWISLARVEEILSRVPKADSEASKAVEYRGSIAAAIDYYKKAAAIHPTSAASKKYAKQAEDMEAEKEKIAELYQLLYKFGHVPARSNPHEFGGPSLPPLGK